MANSKHVCRCVICGRPESECEMPIRLSNDLGICIDCGAQISELMEPYMEEGTVKAQNKKGAKKEPLRIEDIPIPSAIRDKLDEYVIGQEKAKIALAVAVYNHYKRILNLQNEKSTEKVEIAKSNVLLIGPTGVGKTYLAQTLAKTLKVPFAIADATTLTEAGYVGDDVENILLRLIQAADYDIAKAEQGIIYIDEIDKIARKSENRSITRDVSGEGVQQALLKILEGTVASVPPRGGRKHPNQECLRINTKNILFICGGAFEGLDKIVEEREDKCTIGFDGVIRTKAEKKESDLLASVIPHDIIKYGLIPELVGRVPVIVTLKDLNREALISILTQPKNCLVNQYKALFAMDDAELEFEEDALNAIADLALTRNTGARGLRAIVENAMTQLMFDVPSHKNIEKVIVTKDLIEGKGDAKLVYRKKGEETE